MPDFPGGGPPKYATPSLRLDSPARLKYSWEFEESNEPSHNADLKRPITNCRANAYFPIFPKYPGKSRMMENRRLTEIYSSRPQKY